jgi:hypothetical protein
MAQRYLRALRRPATGRRSASGYVVASTRDCGERFANRHYALGWGRRLGKPGQPACHGQALWRCDSYVSSHRGKEL